MNAIGASISACAADVHPAHKASEAATTHLPVIVAMAVRNDPSALCLRYSRRRTLMFAGA